MKIVINDCFGGFGLSDKAIQELIKMGNKYVKDNNCYDIPRDDEDLIKVVKKLGEDANGPYADLKIIKIPDGVAYSIEEYDGIEHIAEKHRTWR